MESLRERWRWLETLSTIKARQMFPVESGAPIEFEFMKRAGSGGSGNTKLAAVGGIKDMMILNEELNYESKGRKLIPGEPPLPFADLISNKEECFIEKEGLPAIKILGMGGVGKTTLASVLRHRREMTSKERLNKLFSIDKKAVGGRLNSLFGLFYQDLARTGTPKQQLISECVVKPGGETKLLHSESTMSFAPDDCMTKPNGNVADNSKNQTSVSALTTEATTVSLQLQDPSGPSNRNRKKRLKKKVKTKANREKIDNNLSRSSSCLMYLFASMHSGGYLLYRIDALEHTHENNELLPLLVFGPDILPVGFCTLVHLGHYIYFVGEKPCDVFKIPKDDIKNLTPGEDNLGLEYLIPIKQLMQGPKRSPLVFVADDNLYVISQDYSCESYEFEKYSPTDDSWTDMNPKPKGHGPLKSHIVLDNIAYFATTDETVLSCNLADGRWSIVSTAPKYPRTFCDIHPAFDAPVLVVGDMILGAFKLPSDFNITVAASPHSRCDEYVKDSFMRPTLAPDSKFWPEFARRFDYIRNSESHGSHYMTALQTLDGQNILCFVSYGSNPSIDEPHRSYALLTFYNILGDHWKTSVRLKEEVLEGGDTFCYYSRQVEAGNAVKSYFKSEFMQRKLFNITTTKLRSTGKLITCLVY